MEVASDVFLITCEHGGNRIPVRYGELFRGLSPLLKSHRGYDAGALTMAMELATALAAPLFVATTSRLLIDLNRSIGHPRLYSEATRRASEAVRREILERYYLGYRMEAELAIQQALELGGRVVHISSHSFTPELDGKIRNADIGLLYDPLRSGELEFCRRWQAFLRTHAPGLNIRRNYPYSGKSDGFTAYLRGRFPDHAYLGIELEINQKHVFKGGRHWRELRRLIVETLPLVQR